MTRRGSAVAALLAAVLTLLVPGTASAASYPVPYTFAADIAGATFPYTSPPGANDWSCRPTAAHPEPVVLVHGFASVQNDTWQTFAPLLANHGYCVFALNYGVPAGTPFPADQVGGVQPIEASAAQLKAFVGRVLAATGASKVDIVGHSEGSQMPDYYARFLGGGAVIDKYVALAGFWHGTNAAGLATATQVAALFGFGLVTATVFATACAACGQLLTGSDYTTTMRAGSGVVVPGIDYTSIVTRYDELAVPYTSGIEPGMTNIVLQTACPLDLTDHFGILADPVAAAHVLNALDPAHPRPVPCVPVAPVLG